MTNCQGCGTDLLSQDRFCKNCGAPVAASVEDLADTRPFDPSAPVVRDRVTPDRSIQTVLDTYRRLRPIRSRRVRRHLHDSVVHKEPARAKSFWLLALFLLLLFIGTGVTIGREAVRARRAQRAEQAREAERSRQAKQARQAEIARRSLEEAIQNAMGFVPGDLLKRSIRTLKACLLPA